MRPLRRHLLFAIMGVALLTTIVLALGVFFISQRQLQRNLDASILQLAKTELASATDKANVHVHDSEPWLLDVKGVPGYAKYVWIEDKNGKVVAKSSNVSPQQILKVPTAFVESARKGVVTFESIDVGAEALRAVAYPFNDVDGSPLVGVVGVHESVVQDAVRSIGEVIVSIGLGCIAISAIVAVALSRRIASPISEFAEQLDSFDPENSAELETLSQPYSELRTLAHSFGQLTERVREVVCLRTRTIEAQRRFVADASHELRTPVSNIQGTLEVTLRRDRAPSEYVEAIEISLMECHRVSRLVNDLLLLSKTDEGVFELQTQPHDLSKLLRMTVAKFGATRVPVRVNVLDNLIVDCDPVRIGQVIDNLVRNALTHATTTVAIQGLRTESGLLIRVGNDGPALDPSQSERVFNRFARLDFARNRDSGGSGLGLAIVKSLVEAHAGKVSAFSDAGWTWFEFTLPAVQDNQKRSQ